MILQALVKYYEDQVALGKISKPGWSKVKVSYALRINDEGDIVDIIDIKTETDRGKKKVFVPREMVLPAQIKRSVNVAANFLCDNSGYILGVSEKGKVERDLLCFAECKNYHIKMLSEIEHPAVKAVIRFFQKWIPEQAKENDLIVNNWDKITDGGNIVFRYKDRYLHEIPEIVETWDKYYSSEGADVKSICLVTGKEGAVEAVHPAIKGIKDAQSSGAALVSFNAPAFCSYGKEQSFNAPTSKYAAFAYTTALNNLISDREKVKYIGDTAVLCWAEGGIEEYRNFANMSLFGADEKYSDQDIRDKVKRIAAGNSVSFDETLLEPDRGFYVLGLAPNAARLSVRFFWHNSFGKMMKNIEAHYERMNIVKPDFERFEEIPIWRLLSETVNQNSKKKMASPVMAGQMLQAVLTDGRYPATLLNNINIRIKADRKVNWYRAAIIKAFYLKNKNINVPEEVLTVALNKETTNVPYNLGRLFSVLENIQMKANPGINATIVDKYFNSASATPATVFPILLNLSQKHLKKIGGGLQAVMAKEMQEILDKLGENFPKRMNLEQQGSFQLGYYHQKQAHFQSKKEEVK